MVRFMARWVQGETDNATGMTNDATGVTNDATDVTNDVTGVANDATGVTNASAHIRLFNTTLVHLFVYSIQTLP